MIGELTGLILDVIVLVFLLTTIFYVMRLSKGLSDFKAHRREFDGLITSLLSSIDQAERSVNTLKQVSGKEAAELDKLIKQSKLMSEELLIINEAGENMAKRLEKLAERNREVAQRSNPIMSARNEEKIHSPVRGRKKDYKSTLKKVDNEEGSELPTFMIQDREFDNIEGLENHLDASVSNDAWDGEDDSMPDNLQSQAEQELFAALRSAKRGNPKGAR